MGLEIELKAWVEDPEALKKSLDTWGEHEKAYEKSDTYWLPAGKPALGPGNEAPSGEFPPRGKIPPSGIRVRREQSAGRDGKSSERTLITYKIRELAGEVEVNEEREFEVKDESAFEDLLVLLNLEPRIRKKKKGWAWNCGGSPPVLAELSHVENLGWFIELEIISGKADGEIVKGERERLLALLDKLGIPRDRIETRPYTLMLKERSVKERP
ncbi:MAG: class IV adenylate cyclase [Treponema sp.]|jgi:adenylate cyclase class 2|nr:class IV adenylate cyclase [Treponema sp.]